MNKKNDIYSPLLDQEAEERANFLTCLCTNNPTYSKFLKYKSFDRMNDESRNIRVV